MSEFSHLSIPDKNWLRATSTLSPPPENPSPVPLGREVTEWVKAANERWDYPKSGVQVSDVSIPVESTGASIRVRTYIPDPNSNDTTLFPVLVWFHGGGFTIGDVDFDDALLRLICKTDHVSCVNVNYRLAPEHAFPIPLQDCYAAIEWVAVNTSSLSADLGKGFMVGGVSAGANLAAVVALKARDDPLLCGKLTGQILQVPAVCPHTAYPEQWRAELMSIDENKDAPLLTREEMVQVYADYGAPDLTSQDVAPLLAANHRGLPSTYLQICGLDPLRDEGILYEKVLRESGVRTKLDIYPGLPHGFWEVDPLMPPSEKWRSDVLKGIKWLIELGSE